MVRRGETRVSGRSVGVGTASELTATGVWSTGFFGRGLGAPVALVTSLGGEGTTGGGTAI